MDNLILNFIHNILKDDSINKEESIIDYNLDSMELIYLFVEIEKEFNIEIANEDLIYNNYKVFNDIIQIVEREIQNL